MWARIFSSSKKSVKVSCRDLRGIKHGPEFIAARHRGIVGFNQSTYSNSSITLIGAGGLNGENGEGFCRKGIGQLIIVDDDDVQLSNLNRQRFTKRDVGKNGVYGHSHNRLSIVLSGSS